jgi:hypothetical protein
VARKRPLNLEPPRPPRKPDTRTEIQITEAYGAKAKYQSDSAFYMTFFLGGLGALGGSI